MLPGVSFMIADGSTGGSYTQETPGLYTFTVPSVFATLTVQIWGAGGGGGGIGDSPGNFDTDGTQYGTTGGKTVFFAPTNLVANGGVGGQTAGGPPSANVDALPGIGGTATGGATNTSGSSGTRGYYGCIGGSSPNGGAATVYLNTQNVGYAGNAPGGGGGGGFSVGTITFPFAAGGGGGGGYSTQTYTPSTLTPETIINIEVGAGGPGGPYNWYGGTGANGKITIVWT